ncbi:DUF1320 domain-containing protein [Salmonella enterica subsp. enterica serovar Abaetetuba]|uniref:gp436 family protein n=1 Tax=Salmonella enterica TaxID=28901 RepID=UPI0008FC30CF|nr:phage protein Gp36 family protein [Salmonella enterica]EAC2150433.1 DUF1320 domain-containing protein [Salmonella enterica subsp. enterica]EAN3269544.1 DUF1320 domain-containing protein [Salmonella enterica subsp. enterica serovar Oranienburg]EAP4168940.1 DUF1320 domain-containing protein [Salmonella enterica subsp. enterica serovar Minnesota]EAR0437050.1 DUF1320 domain-containing protein [Salmonella enterica subsp. enterica serovar Poona]EBV5808130.1 DUF1320 domain-containing protein [Salm
MIYATRDDMAHRYNQDTLAQLMQTLPGQEDTGLLDNALADASALIDSYISARYTLPLSSVPLALTQQCCAIAFYYLNTVRATEQTRKRYEDALRWLEGIRDGKTPLGVAQDSSAPESCDLPEMQSEVAVFTRDQKGFV